jgi:type IV pilus assembly protein PilA
MLPVIIKSKGFTLIEIMIAVAITTTLAAIAIPAYNDYTVRARVSELITAGANAKTTVSNYATLHNGQFPNSNEQANVANIETQYVASLTVGPDGVITVTGSSALGAGDTFAIDFIPTHGDGVINWQCQISAGAPKYVPSTCRNTTVSTIDSNNSTDNGSNTDQDNHTDNNNNTSSPRDRSNDGDSSIKRISERVGPR